MSYNKCCLDKDNLQIVYTYDEFMLLYECVKCKSHRKAGYIKQPEKVIQGENFDKTI